MWTKESLAGLIASRFQGYRLILVSNREPYTHQKSELLKGLLGNDLWKLFVGQWSMVVCHRSTFSFLDIKKSSTANDQRRLTNEQFQTCPN